MTQILFLVMLVIGLIISLVFPIMLKGKFINKIIIYVVAVGLLIWKTIEFSYYHINNKGVYPVELSHICYFLVSAIILSRIEVLYFTGGCLSFISGLGYYITALISPEKMLGQHSNPIVIMGFVSHTLLLLIGSILLFGYKRYKLKHFYIVPLISIIVLSYIVLVDRGIIFSGLASKGYFILDLINGRLLKYINIDNESLGKLTSLLIIILSQGIFLLFNYINNIIFKDKNLKGF